MPAMWTAWEIHKINFNGGDDFPVVFPEVSGLICAFSPISIASLPVSSVTWACYNTSEAFVVTVHIHADTQW